MPAAKTRAPKASKTTKPAKTSTSQKAQKAQKAAKPKGAAGTAWKPTLAELMKTLEKAGTAQTKKTFMRHGAVEPLFGVLFGTLSGLWKKIRVDHDLAMALWDTGNFDARNLAFKLVDPARMTPADLDRWSDDTSVRMCGLYVSSLAVETPHGFSAASRWLASSDEGRRHAGWGVVGQLAARDTTIPDAWFSERLDEIVRTIHASPNAQRGAMNTALITIGGRSAALRKAALAAAKKIGTVEVDHGDTECKTPDAAAYIEKMWAHAKAKDFDSPAAQERERESMRTRC